LCVDLCRLYQIRRLPFTGGTAKRRKGKAVAPPRATSLI